MPVPESKAFSRFRSLLAVNKPLKIAFPVQIMDFHCCGCGSVAPLCNPEIQGEDLSYKAGELRNSYFCGVT